MPGLMGAQMRRRGKVDSFSSGVEEGAKGMAYGLYDGITGLVTEPLRGAKSGGVDGFIKGSWNSGGSSSLASLPARMLSGR